MISDEEKIKKANIGNNFVESHYEVEKEDEDIDFNLLFDTLDSIFEGKIIVEENLHTDIKKPKTSTYDLLKFVQRMYQNTWWNLINQPNEVRPELSTTCLSLTCSHVSSKGSRLNIECVVDDPLENCSHKITEDWLFDDICAKCIIVSCETVTLAEPAEFVVLWDETDLIHYFDWIEKIDKDSGFHN